jgi:hypothetical protein
MLRCEECGKEPRTEEEALRWRAYVTVSKTPEEQVDSTHAARLFEALETLLRS